MTLYDDIKGRISRRESSPTPTRKDPSIEREVKEAICRGCDSFMPDKERCVKVGCLRCFPWARAQCPDNKWKHE